MPHYFICRTQITVNSIIIHLVNFINTDKTIFQLIARSLTYSKQKTIIQTYSNFLIKSSSLSTKKSIQTAPKDHLQIYYFRNPNQKKSPPSLKGFFFIQNYFLNQSVANRK